MLVIAARKKGKMPYDIIIGRTESDKELFGKEALIYVGKSYVKMGETSSLSNPIYIDAARSHVILVAGKRGSGKSYTLGVIAEGISTLPENVAKNIGVLIFDTMGIFWTMAYKNEKEEELLHNWGIEARNIPLKIFVPFGYAKEWEEKGIPVTKSFAISAAELTADDWAITFGLGFLDPVSILIQRVVTKLRETGEDFDVDSIIAKIKDDRETNTEVKNAGTNIFEGAKTWGLFASSGKKGTPIKDLIQGGTTSVLDLSCYSSIGTFNVRALVIGLISKKLFNERIAARKMEEVEAVRHGLDYLEYKEKREMPLVWLVIDEAHEFLPKEGKTAATDALVQLLREGRQPGISMALATQQPGAIHRDVMTQSDIVLSHRVTAQPDMEALNYIMQSYLMKNIKTYLNDLPKLKGTGIILDDNSERIYSMRARARFTWHGGEAPTAIKVKKRI